MASNYHRPTRRGPCTFIMIKRSTSSPSPYPSHRLDSTRCFPRRRRPQLVRDSAMKNLSMWLVFFFVSRSVHCNGPFKFFRRPPAHQLISMYVDAFPGGQYSVLAGPDPSARVHCCWQHLALTPPAPSGFNASPPPIARSERRYQRPAPRIAHQSITAHLLSLVTTKELARCTLASPDSQSVENQSQTSTFVQVELSVISITRQVGKVTRDIPSS